MKQGMLLFIGIFTLLQALWCFYLGRRLLSPDLPPHARVWLWGTLIILFVFQWLIPADMWMDRLAPDYSPFRTFLYWAGYLITGFLTLLLFLVFFRDLAGWISTGMGWSLHGWFPDIAEGSLSIGRSLFSSRGSLILASTALVLTIAGFVQAVLPPRVVRVDVAIANLAPEFEGYSIAQISDIHFGPTIRRSFARRLSSQVNALNADLVAFTGDVTDGLVEKLRSDVEPLKDMKGRDGKLFVTGNHEYYWDAPGWIIRMKELGYSVLMNEHIIVKRGMGRLVVGGIPDFTAHRIPLTESPDISKAFSGAPPDTPKILLAHQPKEGHAAKKAGVDLVLSGHTHAGQFIPFNLLTKLAQPLLGGLYRLGATQVYVNRGTAYWGPPNRLGIPSEITLITLRRK